MSKEPILHKIQKEWHGTLKSYMIGFFTSLLLTSLSFLLVLIRPFSINVLIYTIIGLAITQAITQLLFFLHIGQESKPRYETLSLLFSVLILLIVTIGSLWVMHDLNFRMMPEMTGVMSHD